MAAPPTPLPRAALGGKISCSSVSLARPHLPQQPLQHRLHLLVLGRWQHHPLPSLAPDDGFIDMFRKEAALCSQFSHPCVVQVLDFGRFADSYFLAMEYLDGPPPSRVLRAHKGKGLPVPAVLHLAISLCEALEYVHERRDPGGKDLRLVPRDLNHPTCSSGGWAR